MLCILYFTVFGAGLGAAGLLVERALPAAWPRRWLWCGVIAVATIVPGVQRAHHVVAVGTPAGGVGATGTRGMLFLLVPMRWASTGAYDAAINRLWCVASAGLLAWALLGAAWVAYEARRGRGGRTVVDGARVVVTDRIGPATVGLLRPRVLLPRWVLALPAADRRYVVRHEAEHRRAHDTRVLGLASLALLLTPWNVALWWHLRRLHLAVETDCDRRVVRALGDARAYGALLLRVAEAAGRGPHLAPLTRGVQPAFLGRAGMLERRLTALVRPPTRGDHEHVSRVVLPLVAGALLAALLALPHPIAAGPRGHPVAHRSASDRAAARDAVAGAVGARR